MLRFSPFITLVPSKQELTLPLGILRGALDLLQASDVPPGPKNGKRESKRLLPMECLGKLSRGPGALQREVHYILAH